MLILDRQGGHTNPRKQHQNEVERIRPEKMRKGRQKSSQEAQLVAKLQKTLPPVRLQKHHCLRTFYAGQRETRSNVSVSAFYL